MLTATKVTTNFQIYKCRTRRVPKFYMLDTPGFESPYETDTEVLKRITDWLKWDNYNIRLTGIIVLHRITDVRFENLGGRNSRMYKELCGKDLSSVVAATTLWDSVCLETGSKRHYELISSEKWRSMIREGSKVFRQDKEKQSAARIIEHLVAQRKPREPVVPATEHQIDYDIRKLQLQHREELERLRLEMEEAIERAQGVDPNEDKTRG